MASGLCKEDFYYHAQLYQGIGYKNLYILGYHTYEKLNSSAILNKCSFCSRSRGYDECDKCGNYVGWMGIKTFQGRHSNSAVSTCNKCFAFFELLKTTYEEHQWILRLVPHKIALDTLERLLDIKRNLNTYITRFALCSYIPIVHDVLHTIIYEMVSILVKG